jgi:hypothetical protein
MKPEQLTKRIEALSEKLKPVQLEGIKIDFYSFTEPEQLLTRDALIGGAITCKNKEDFENRQLQILGSQLKQLIRQEASV